MTYAVITGGGTGGHVYPGLALAKELVARGHRPSSISFVGARRGLEAKVVPEAGFELDLLPGRGLERRVTARNLRTLWDTAVACRRAYGLLRQLRPRVVVGFGGYASFPCLLAATAMRIPRIVHDQDAAPGLANRIAVRLGAQAAVSLPDTPLRGAVLTGNPVRAELLRSTRHPAQPPLVACFGGSLGSGSINDAALELYDRWRDREDVQVHHVVGPRNLVDCERRLGRLRRDGDALSYHLVGYEDRMDALLARTAVAVCRSGAGTVAEIAAAGTPAILVPLPGAPADHQTRNAETLAASGAAVVVRDDELTGARLAVIIDELLAEPGRLDAMSTAARSLAHLDAAARLADLVEDLAGG